MINKNEVMPWMNWHEMDIDSVFRELNTGKNGLSETEALSRQKNYGLNELQEKEGSSIWVVFLKQFGNVLVLILLIAAVVSGLLGEISDAVIIMVVVVLNAVLGVVQEERAQKSLNSLKKLVSPAAVVKRNGKVSEIPAKELVPGDVVLLEAGRYIPADCRLFEVSNLKAEESSLTGESVPVEKFTEKITDLNAGIGDRKNMGFMSSLVSYGKGTAIVTGTGMSTEIGKIAGMIQQEDKSSTPLQVKLGELGKWLGIISVGICIILFLIGILEGKNYLEMFMTSVSLAVAAIPEGLPAVVTIVLAIGVQRMIRRKAIIRKLPAVETLGCATVIYSDKTGTLTQNKMTVTKLYINGETIDPDDINMDLDAMLVYAFVLCNDTRMSVDNGNVSFIGDPTETALVEYAYKAGIDKNDFEGTHHREGEIPFDSERKLMTTINSFKDTSKIFVKGAPDILLERCRFILDKGNVRTINNNDLINIRAANENMACDALRVLGCAYRDLDNTASIIVGVEMENNLVFIGLAGMIDPPREESKEAVRICKAAGIKPVMITGDHKATAVAIARELGIMDNEHHALSGAELEKIDDDTLSVDVEKYNVYARVSPEHKVKIIKAWQSRGQIVAMTGDGVNDAPALKKADIGAAMGITGTDVAKEAADMVLMDDNFTTIVSAVEEGRIIYDNIKKTIHYLMSCNMGEIITIFAAILLGWVEPLLPIHILWINLVTDTFPALALGLDPAEKGIMKRRPRNPKSGIFEEGLGWRVAAGGVIIGTVSLMAYYLGLNYGTEDARTMAFLVLSISQLFHAQNVRSNNISIFRTGVFSNRYLAGATFLSIILQFGVIFIPFMRELFKVSLLDINQWIIVMLLSAVPIGIVEIIKLVERKKNG